MLKGFKDFLLRGNVIDLSVAVIVGAAFGAIVKAFTDNVLKPLINAITPPTSPGFGIQLVQNKPSTFIDAASVITTAINFIMVAGVVYFAIVLPMRKLQERRKRGEESGPAEPTDIELLKEIRDLLSVQAGTSTTAREASRRLGDLTQAGGANSNGAGKVTGTVAAQPTAAEQDEPALFTQPHRSVPTASGTMPMPSAADTASRRATGAVGRVGQAIRSVGGRRSAESAPATSPATTAGTSAAPAASTVRSENPVTTGGRHAPGGSRVADPDGPAAGGQPSGGGRHSAQSQSQSQPAEPPPERPRQGPLR